MSHLRRAIRVPWVSLNVIVGVVAILAAVGWDRLRGNGLHRGSGRRAQVFWSARVGRLLGVRVQCTGGPVVAAPALLVSNHRSWLDILLVSTLWPVCFLSKSEVKRWPGIGPVATGLGTLYIQRGDRDAAGEAAAAMVDRLRAGHYVLFFPEGTTTPGGQLRRFRPRLYQAAIDAGVPVQPLVLEYHDASGAISRRAPFTGEQGLFANVIGLAGEARTHCTIRVCAPIDPATCSGRTALARASRAAMAEALGHATGRDTDAIEAPGRRALAD